MPRVLGLQLGQLLNPEVTNNLHDDDDVEQDIACLGSPLNMHSPDTGIGPDTTTGGVAPRAIPLHISEPVDAIVRATSNSPASPGMDRPMGLHGPPARKEECKVETPRDGQHFVDSGMAATPRMCYALPGIPFLVGLAAKLAGRAANM